MVGPLRRVSFHCIWEMGPSRACEKLIGDLTRPPKSTTRIEFFFVFVLVFFSRKKNIHNIYFHLYTIFFLRSTKKKTFFNELALVYVSARVYKN